MNIFVNGKPYTCEHKEHLTSLLHVMGYGKGSFAIALNGDFVPKVDYAVTALKEGDAVDIVAPIQGG